MIHTLIHTYMHIQKKSLHMHLSLSLYKSQGCEYGDKYDSMRVHTGKCHTDVRLCDFGDTLYSMHTCMHAREKPY